MSLPTCGASDSGSSFSMGETEPGSGSQLAIVAFEDTQLT